MAQYVVTYYVRFQNLYQAKDMLTQNTPVYCIIKSWQALITLLSASIITVK